MHGLGLRRRGDVAINYGSGAFVLVHAGEERAALPGLLTTLLVSWSPVAGAADSRLDRPAEFAIEGTVNSAATAVEWARRRLRLRVPYDQLDRYMDRDPAPKREVHFLPAIAGLGAPRWDASARPRFRGNLRVATPRDLLRAAVESIAYRCAENLRAAAGRVPADDRPIVVAGGLTSCRTLLQAQADLLQRPLILRETPEATAVGAALMARASWRGTPPLRRAGAGRLVIPGISRDEAETRYAAWERAVYRR
jgi:glycerol kinase